MGRFLGSVFHAVAQLLAGVFSVLFVVTAVLVTLLISVDRALLNADTYKRALAEQGLYERMPALAAEQLGALETFIANPCAENPLVCRIDGASPELQACLTDALGQEALVELGTFKREPTEAELRLGQPCLDQFAPAPAPESALAASAPEAQTCVRQAVGEEVFDTLLHDERQPTDAEAQAIALCSEGVASASDSGGEMGISGSGVEGGDSGGPGGEPMGFLNNLTPEDWEKLISTLLPPDELQVMIEQALDQGFAFLDGEVDSASISLVALRERLVGPAGQEVIELLLAAQPPCTEAQLAQLTVDVAEGEGDLVLCQPQAEDAEALMFHMQARFDSLVAEMPDEAELIKPPSSSAPAVGGGPPGDDPSPAAPTNRGGPLGDDPLAALRLLRQWLWLSLLIPLGLLLVVTVFGVRSRKGWLRWWGIPMFVAGLLTTSLGIAAVPALDWVWLGYVAAHLPPMFSSSLSSVAHTLADSVVRELTQWILLGGGSVMLLGLAAIVGSFYVREGGQ
jgi:hypothetical protein